MSRRSWVVEQFYSPIDHFNLSVIDKAAINMWQILLDEAFANEDWDLYNELKKDTINTKRSAFYDVFICNCLYPPKGKTLMDSISEMIDLYKIKDKRTIRFNKDNYEISKNLLKRMRNSGSQRLLSMINAKSASDICISTGLRKLLPLIKSFGIEKGVFLDCGCGESADVFYMARNGFESYGIDVFPLSSEFAIPKAQTLGCTAERFYSEISNASFIQHDMCLPFDKGLKIDVALSYWSACYLDRFDRKDFYRVIRDALKTGGVFCCWMPWAYLGYPEDSDIEIFKEVFTERNFELVKIDKAMRFCCARKRRYTKRALIAQEHHQLSPPSPNTPPDTP